MRYLPYYICLFALIFCSGLNAQGFGASSGLLMAETLAARPQSMAGAFTALADDESSINTNPAGLAMVSAFRLSGSHMIGLLDTQVEYLSMATPLGPNAGVGLQAAFLHDTDTFRDNFGNEHGEFNNSNIMAGLAWAWAFRPGWRFGLGFKGIQENYFETSSLAFAADIGLQGPIKKGWTFGLSVQNAGAQSATGDESWSIPLRINLGIAAPIFMKEWKLCLDTQILPIEQQARILVGTELKFSLPGDRKRAFKEKTYSPPSIALRAGFSTGLIQDEPPRASLGAGFFVPPHYEVNYALVSLGSLGASHRVAVSFIFPKLRGPGPKGRDLMAVTNIAVVEQLDGLILNWDDPNRRVDGYNIYSDYGVFIEKLNPLPVGNALQKFIKITRSRTYNFYIRPLGSDGLEGPASRIKTYKYK